MKKYEWIWAIIKVNWSNVISNRKAFYMMLILMCVQNFLYFSLWFVIFSKISSLRGWQLSDVAFLYGAGAAGFGFFFTFLGGMNQLGHVIQNGELDIHLARPRSPLLLAILQRMRADSLGDVLSGALMIGLLTQFDISKLPLILVLTVSTGFIYFAFRLIMHSLSFWGMSGDACERGFGAFIITSTNPQNGFSPLMKAILLTVIPAGYVGLLPVEIVRHFRWDYLVLQLAVSSGFFVFSLWLFGRGLRRYASGNKFLSLR